MTNILVLGISLAELIYYPHGTLRVESL